MLISLAPLNHLSHTARMANAKVKQTKTTWAVLVGDVKIAGGFYTQMAAAKFADEFNADEFAYARQCELEQGLSLSEII